MTLTTEFMEITVTVATFPSSGRRRQSRSGITVTVATFPFLNYGDSCNILFFIIPFFISLKKGNVATVTVIQKAWGTLRSDDQAGDLSSGHFVWRKK